MKILKKVRQFKFGGALPQISTLINNSPRFNNYLNFAHFKQISLCLF